MQNHEVIPSFDILLHEINGVVSYLNRQGAHLLSEEKYNETRTPIKKVESNTDIHSHVESLKEKWTGLQIKTSKPSSQKTSQTKRKKLQSVKMRFTYA